jgi:Ca-activated chloride channel family protein
MKILRVFAAVLACALLTAAQQATQTAPESTQDVPTFKVDVKLVNVFTTVVDENGAPVGVLERENFEVFEDSQPQTIAVYDRESELPLSIVMAIDASLSARPELKLELESARRFARNILRPIDALSLYQFSEHVVELVPFTSDLKQIDRGIRRVRVGAATALYDAIYLGAEALQPRNDRKVMVLITDGGDTVSRSTYGEAVRAAQEAEAIVYSVIIVPIEASPGRNTGGENALIQLAHDTGGKHYYAKSTGELDAAFQQISNELRTQYLVAYYPTQRLARGSFRRIEIRLKPSAAVPDVSRFTPRHRSGYFTHSQSWERKE